MPLLLMLYQYFLIHLRCYATTKFSPRRSSVYKREALKEHAVQRTTAKQDWPDSTFSLSPFTCNYMIGCFFSVLNVKVNIKSLTMLSSKSTIFRQGKEFKVLKHRSRKCHKHFGTRATGLYNPLMKTTDKPMSKQLLVQMYTSSFTVVTMNLTAAAADPCETVEIVASKKTFARR